MYKKEFPPILESVEELQARLRRERDARLRLRLRLLILVRSGQVATRREAAERLAVHRNSVRNWLAAYEHGSLGALLRIGTSGPKREQKTLPPPVFEALRERVEAEGFPGYAAAQQWLRQEFGLEVPYRTVHGIIRYRLNARLKRAPSRRGNKTRRPRPARRSPPPPA
jgi:transposase